MGLIAEAARRRGSIFSTSAIPAPAPQAPPEQGGGISPLGFFGNLVGDFTDLAKGLTSLGGIAIGDVIHGATLGKVGEEFRSDDLIRGLPGAVASDYASRYGSPSKFARGLYEHPGSFLLDLLGAGQLAGKGAALAAKAAPVAEGVQAIRAGTLARETAPMGIRAVESILPKTQSKLIGSELTQVTERANPVTRALFDRPKERLLTQPIENLETQASELKALAEAGQALPGQVRQAQELADLVAKARGAGISRVESEFAVRRRLRKAVDALKGDLDSQWLRVREEDMAAFREALKPVADAKLGDQVHGYFQRLDVEIPELRTHQVKLPGYSARKPVELGLAGKRTPGRLTFETRADVVSEPVGGNYPFVEYAHGQAGRISAFRNGQPVGHLDYQAPPGTGPVTVAMVEVAPAVQKQGIATELLRKLREENPGREIDPGFTTGEGTAWWKKAESASAAPPGPRSVVDEVMVRQRDRKLRDAMESVRQIVDERLTAPAIEAGYMTPEQALERAYRPLRIKHGAKYDPNAVDALTGEKGAWVGGPSVEELDAAFDAAGLAKPIYFPHIDARRLKPSDFLRSMKLVGGRRSAKPGYLKLNTGALLRRGAYVRDPIEAYTRRAALGVRHEETLRFFDKMLDTFGRPVSSIDEIGPSEALVAPDGVHTFFRGKIKFSDELQDLLGQGIDEDAALAQALKEAIIPLQDDIARQFVGVARGKLYAVPKVVAERLDSHVKSLFPASAERKIRLFWDTPMNVWRGAALAGAPRWVLNNVLGNIAFTKMQGAKLRDAVAVLENRFVKVLNEKMGTRFDTSLLKDLERLPGSKEASGGFFRMEQQYNPRRGFAADTRTGALYSAIGATRPAQAVSRAGQFMRKVNGEIENAFRQASYIKAAERQQVAAGVRKAGRSFWSTKRRLEEVTSHGFTDDAARSALDEVNHFMNDYSRMGPWERKVVRRFIAPFWSFYKHTARLLLSYPLDFPARTELLKALTDTSNEIVAEAQEGPVPAFLEGMLPLGTGPEGETQFLNTRSANPFSGLAQSPIGMLAPPLKVGLEQLQGRNVYTGREFSAPDVVKPFGSSQRYRVDAETGTATPVEQVRPGILEHLLRQVPQYQLAEDLIAGGDTYDTANLGSIIANRVSGEPGGAIRRTPEGEARYPFDALQQLLRFSGISTTDYDLGAFRERLTEEQIAALTYYLRQIGALPPAS